MMATSTRFEWSKVDELFPGLKAAWKRLRALHEIRTRAPKHITVTDGPMISTPWNDSYIGRLHRLDLQTMEVSESCLNSTYDVAPYVTHGMVGDTGAVFGSTACVKLEWNDHYRHVCLTVQVPAGSLPKALTV